jgi:hypothetical protein
MTVIERTTVVPIALTAKGQIPLPSRIATTIVVI